MVKFEPWVWYGAGVVMGKFESCTGLEAEMDKDEVEDDYGEV